MFGKALNDYYNQIYGHDINEEDEEDNSICPPPVEMPNGTVGYKCLGCHMFCAYVESNCSNGYICADCRNRR